jgi:hypothetical protein
MTASIIVSAIEQKTAKPIRFMRTLYFHQKIAPNRGEWPQR